jgi:beta-glucosidase
MRFPDGFVWGAATAAYQIEGAPASDGKGASIWDTFSHQPGKTWHGDTGDIACDSYHRTSEDLDLLERLGVTAYRFSMSWPRIQPDGRGAVNQEGLDYYKRLATGLRRRGITPVATLYHWDLPQPLQDKGGWATRDMAEIFADYAEIAAGNLGDLVHRWITINEPWVVASLGYRWGMHAPGITDDAQASAATHHLLLAHGRAVPALRAGSPGPAEVGITLNMSTMRPAVASDSAGAGAVEAAAVHATAVRDAGENGVFLEPLLRGRYPDLLLPDLRPDDVRDGDFDVIRAPVDFLGVNYYSPHFVGADGHDVRPDGIPVTAMDWLVDPSGLYDLLIRLRDAAPGLPLYITENGAACHDYVSPSGTVDDYERIEYLDGHLRAAAKAIADGVNLRGYFAWSLLDNFEWAEGYSKRFGLVFTDFGTQRRILKRSGEWYAAMIANNGLE